MKFLHRLRLRWRNNRKISRALAASLWLVLLIPATANANLPNYDGNRLIMYGGGSWEDRIASQGADYALIRLRYPYYGEWRRMSGPNWQPAYTWKTQEFVYGSKYPRCEWVAFQIVLENNSGNTWHDTAGGNPCVKSQPEDTGTGGVLG